MLDGIISPKAHVNARAIVFLILELYRCIETTAVKS